MENCHGKPLSNNAPSVHSALEYADKLITKYILTQIDLALYKIKRIYLSVCPTFWLL